MSTCAGISNVGQMPKNCQIAYQIAIFLKHTAQKLGGKNLNLVYFGGRWSLVFTENINAKISIMS